MIIKKNIYLINIPINPTIQLDNGALRLALIEWISRGNMMHSSSSHKDGYEE